MRRSVFLVVASLTVWAAPGQAPSGPAPLGQKLPYVLTSGILSNGGDRPKQVWIETLSIPGATSLQLLFETAELQTSEDAIVVTNPRDGEQQRLTRANLKLWRNHTAWFNGDRVAVAVELAPGSTAQVVIRHVYGGIQPILGTSNSICDGADDRVNSNDTRVCRLTYSATACFGCTGFLISSTNTVLGAGHCANPAPEYFVIAEFNTPASTACGCAQHPPVADQYPVDQSTILSSDGVVGDDWAVARLHPNSAGQTAFTNQGSYFTLATSLPPFIPPFFASTLRVTGHGDDLDNLTRAYDQQTDTGSPGGYSGDVVFHRVDTRVGNSGSPVIHEPTGEAIAIHTDGGCHASSTSYNKGTSVLKPALQAAIGQTVGCSAVALTSSTIGSAVPVTCDFQVFNGTPASGTWVGFGITSASDWDVVHEAASSVFGGGNCDFIIANGNQGSVPPTSGEFNRWSGNDSAYGDLLEAQTLAIQATGFNNWGSTDVMQMFQVHITSTGIYDVTVSGSSELRWRLYGPGTGPDWRSRSSSTLIASGTGVSGTAGSISLPSTGWHVIVVYKDGGVGGVTPSQFGVTVCDATSPTLLTNEVPATITNPCQGIFVSPTANKWNVVGVSSPADWDLVMGSATSWTFGADFALANGHNGPVAPTWGQVNRFGGLSDATVEAEDAALLFGTGANTVETFAAGEILELCEVFLPATGTHAITVVGDPSISWRFYAPQSNADWISETASIASGNGGGGTVNATVSSTGHHALLLYRDLGPSPNPTSVMVNVCPVSTNTNLLSTLPTTVSGPCNPFTFTVESGRWNAVGCASSADWDIGVGEAYSRSVGDITDFVVANGRNGAIAPLNGIASRWSISGGAHLQRSNNVTLTLGTPYTAASWPTNRVIRVFEFEVLNPGSHDITMSNAAPLNWRLFDPGADAGFRPRSASMASGTDGVTSTVNLTPGWHALVCTTDSGLVSSSLTFTMLVEPTPNPSPSTSALAPTSAIAGGPSFTLTAIGSNFTAGSTIRWNGSTVTTTYVGPTQLTGTVPASFIASAGTASVDVQTPAPGGGVSASQAFTINNPVPTLSSLSPPSATAGSGNFTLNVNGSNFNSSSMIQWNGLSRPTTLVAAGLLRCTIPASLIFSAGTHNVQVHNPAPGGGITAVSTFTVNNPVPTVTSAMPTTAVAGSAALPITVTGSNFNASSVIRFDGLGVATTLVSATTVTATVPTAALATAGLVVVGVENPAPGGGFSSSTFTIENPVPTLTSTAPTFAIAGDVAFTLNVNGADFVSGDSQVRWNGAPILTTFVSSTHLQAAVSATLIGLPGAATVDVNTAGPGGGTSGTITFPVLAPTVLTLTPATIPILTATSPAQNITITGANFHPGTQAYADGYALPTTYANSSTLSCAIGPSVLGALRRGGLAIAVENAHTVPSNAIACPVGGLGSNAGTVIRNPLDPLPGEPYAARCEGGLPGAPLLLLADLTNPAPVHPWPSPAADFVLSVRGSQPAVPGDWFVIVDGIGVFGPPGPGVTYDALGEFIVPGLTLPNPALGWTITVQGAYIDPGSPVGFTLQWARYPDQL